MIKKTKSICIIIMILFCINMIHTWDSNSSSISRTNVRSGYEGFEWRPIDVISEPIFGLNNNDGFSDKIRIAVENDKVYVVWEDDTNYNRSGTDDDIFYRYFDGTTWSDIQVISEPVIGKNFNVGHDQAPDIFVENGIIYVVWESYNNTNNAGLDGDIFIRCNITGYTWEDTQVVSEPIFNVGTNGKTSEDPRIAVYNGKIYIVWTDWNNTNGCASTDSDIFYRCNITGNSWGDIQVISEPVYGNDFNKALSFRVAIAAENDNIYVVWQDSNNTQGSGGDWEIHYRCNLTGTSWEAMQPISEPVIGKNINNVDSIAPDIAVENGKLYAVWQDDNNTNGAGGADADIFYRTNLTGSSWEDIQVVSEPKEGMNINTGFSLFPEIDVENDKFYVVWYDNNNTNGSSTDWDIFYRCNLGSGWENIQVISEPVFGDNFNIAESRDPDIAVDQGRSYVVWKDLNNTNGAGTEEDIFFRFTSRPLFMLYPKVNPAKGNTSTIFNYTIKYLHLYNEPPIEIKVNINGINHSMLEVNNNDLNYFDGKDYYFNTKLDINNNHFYQFWTSDINYTKSTAKFNNPDVYNTPPTILTIDNSTAMEDNYYEVGYEYQDIDLLNVGQIGVWNYSSNASWLNFDLVTGLLDGTPTDSHIGEYWVNISINDTMEIDFTNFTLTVLNVNDDPIINTTNIEITYEDELYEVDYNATDIDSIISNQIWSLDTNATAWLDIDPTMGIINGTPTNDNVGSYWVNVSVIDGDNGLAFTNFSLIVINVNDPPVIITEDIHKINTSELYEVDYNATDIDSPSSQFSWSVNTNATWLDIDSSTGILNGTPLKTDAGRYNVNVTINDGDDGLDWHDFVLEVIKKNEAPIITTTDVLSATVDVPYQVKYEANDEDTPLEKLSWFLDTNASWLGVGPITGILGGTPREADLGFYWVKVTVNDSEGGFDSHNFTLTVYSTLNQPPNITTPDDTNALVDEEYLVNYEAEDDRTPLGNLLWSLETNASWLGIENNTGILSGTPNATHVGWYWVKVSVFDREDGWDSTNFTLFVTTEAITKFPPELSNPSMTPTTGDTNTEFTFSVDYSHPDGDLSDSIKVVIDGNAINMESVNGHYEYKTKLSEGNHTYYFTTKLGEFTVNTGTSNTGYITKIEDPSEDGDGDGDEDNTMLYAIVGIIVVIIVVLILLFLFLKKKKEKEELLVEEAQPPPPEEVPPEVPPEQPSPDVQPTEQLPEEIPTEGPPEQVPVPETSPSEQPPTPEVSPEQVPEPETPSPEQPQVPQPQVEPVTQPAPMPQVEEQPQSTPQVEPAPQVEAQEPVVEHPVEPQGQTPVPRVKEPTVKPREDNVE